MKFDLSNQQQLKEAEEYFDQLKERKALVDITRKFGNRTLNQNRYVHLLLSYCALQYGEHMEYFKQTIWKQVVAPEVFKSTYKNRITGEEREDWRSSADLSTKEMTDAIEALRHFASKELGIYLPDASDTVNIQRIENELELNRQYL